MDASNRIAFNTIIQYIRLGLNVIVGLYSIRLILNALGVVDYGIYDVVAGFIALLGFMNSALSQTSIRYISVSIGKGVNHETKKTFNNCFWLHFLIGVGIVFILELAGYFAFNGLLNIPSERVLAAKAVYQFMVVTTFLQVIITPLNAIIIAHEQFLFFSIVGILDSVLKLGIALTLTIYPNDRLIYYGVLMMFITLINFLLISIYIAKNYKHEVSVRKIDFVGIKSVSSFAGWTLLDVIGVVATRQGFSVLINRFFGSTVNGVFALARQVDGNVYSISSSAIETMKPQIMKCYGQGDIQKMLRLSFTAGKFGYSMMSFISIPLIVLMPEVLLLWLGNVPEGTVLFTRLLEIACMMEQLTRGLVYACQALGNIKWFSIIVSAIRTLALPISWIAYRNGAEAYVALIIFLICETIGSFSRVLIMSKISTLSIPYFLKDVVFRIFPVSLLSFGIALLLSNILSGLIGIILIFLITAIANLLLLLLIGLTVEEKHSVIHIFKSIIQKFQVA